MKRIKVLVYTLKATKSLFVGFVEGFKKEPQLVLLHILSRLHKCKIPAFKGVKNTLTKVVKRI